MSSDKEVPPLNDNSIPEGRFSLIGIDVDTTGRRLIDEIVQLSVYAPNKSYSQYIMPYMNLNPAARQRHQVRVITMGYYRMLKSMQTYKVIKTKTEAAALLEFLNWLEEFKNSDKNSNGIILIYHEQRKFIPYIILEAFKKYDLLSRFLAVVRFFANSYEFAATKCANSVKYLNLRQLYKVLFNNDDKMNNIFEGSASVRAKLTYEIVQHLARSELKEPNPDMEMKNMSDIIMKYSNPVSMYVAELKQQRDILERQNTLRPIFLQYFKITLYHRVKAVTFRRVLSENGFNLESLKNIWEEKKRDGLLAIVDKMEELKGDQKMELVDILDSFFDPQKTPLKPAVKQHRRNRRNSRYGKNKENLSPSNVNSNNNNNNYQESGTPENNNNDTKLLHVKPKIVKNENNNDILVPQNSPCEPIAAN